MYKTNREVRMKTKSTFQLTELRSMPQIKRAAYKGPVLLTEKGSPEFVFMTISDYQKLTGKGK